MALTSSESIYLAGEALPSPVAPPIISPEVIEAARRIPMAALLATAAVLVYGEADRFLGRSRNRV
jgi:hypothetical protein